MDELVRYISDAPRVVPDEEIVSKVYLAMVTRRRIHTA